MVGGNRDISESRQAFVGTQDTQLKKTTTKRLCLVAPDALPPASVHSLWSSYISDWPWLDNPLRAAVIPVSCAPFSTTLSLHPLNFLWVCLDTALWTASVSSDDLLRLNLLVEVVNHCLLHNCQVSSRPHDCEAYWNRLRDRSKSQETCDTLSLQYGRYIHNILIFWGTEFGVYMIIMIITNKGLKYLTWI